MATALQNEVSETIRTITPSFDKVLIERDEAKDQIGGIFLPDAGKEQTLRGTVIACGEGRLTPSGSIVPLRVKAGTRVLFGLYAGLKVPDVGLNGADIDADKSRLLMVREDEILGTW